MAMHRIGLLEGGTGCAGLLSRALPPGLWARCHPAQAGGVYDLLLVAPDWCWPGPGCCCWRGYRRKSSRLRVRDLDWK